MASQRCSISLSNNTLQFTIENENANNKKGEHGEYNRVKVQNTFWGRSIRISSLDESQTGQTGKIKLNRSSLIKLINAKRLEKGQKKLRFFARSTNKQLSKALKEVFQDDQKTQTALFKQENQEMLQSAGQLPKDFDRALGAVNMQISRIEGAFGKELTPTDQETLQKLKEHIKKKEFQLAADLVAEETHLGVYIKENTNPIAQKLHPFLIQLNERLNNKISTEILKDIKTIEEKYKKQHPNANQQDCSQEFETIKRYIEDNDFESIRIMLNSPGIYEHSGTAFQDIQQSQDPNDQEIAKRVLKNLDLAINLYDNNDLEDGDKEDEELENSVGSKEIDFSTSAFTEYRDLEESFSESEEE